LEHLEHRRNSQSMQAVADAHGISRQTAYNWIKEKEEFGKRRRVRKRTAKNKGHKLSRPKRVEKEKLKALLKDETNPVRDKLY
jgi:transposase-like protein